MSLSVPKNLSNLPLRFSSAPFHRTVYTRLSLTKGTNVANFKCLLTRVGLVENLTGMVDFGCCLILLLRHLRNVFYSNWRLAGTMANPAIRVSRRAFPYYCRESPSHQRIAQEVAFRESDPDLHP